MDLTDDPHPHRPRIPNRIQLDRSAACSSQEDIDGRPTYNKQYNIMKNLKKLTTNRMLRVSARRAGILIATLLLASLSTSLTAHDDEIPHSHHIDSNTGERYIVHALPNGEIRHLYYRPDGTKERADIYDRDTGRIRKRNYYHADGRIIARTDWYDRATGNIRKRRNYRTDGTYARTDSYDRDTGKIRKRRNYGTDGKWESTEYYDPTTGELTRTRYRN